MDRPTSIWDQCLEYAALSDVGLRRGNNQDAYALFPAANQTDFKRWGHFFMVADGMGAHAAGELASKMATEVISLVYRKRTGQSPSEAIVSATLDANRQIHERGMATADFRGMGTTATTLLLLPAGAMVAHVGDSRAYRLRGNQFEQLTFDHSLVWELQAAGQRPAVKSPVTSPRTLSPDRSARTRLFASTWRDLTRSRWATRSCYAATACRVKSKMMKLAWCSIACRRTRRSEALVDLANLRGGPDNITVIVVRVLGPQIAQGADCDDLGGASNRGRPIHPLLWTIIGVASLAAAGLFALDYPLMALLSVAGAGVAGVVALWHRYAATSPTFETDGRQFGRGPYVHCDCTANANLLARLAEITRQLRDAALAENWSIDWGRFDGFLTQAAVGFQAGRLVNAARDYLHAITFLMSELRNSESPAIVAARRDVLDGGTARSAGGRAAGRQSRAVSRPLCARRSTP